MSESQLRFTPNLGQNGSECVSDDSTSQKYIWFHLPEVDFKRPKFYYSATLLGTEGTFPWHGSFDCDFNFIGPLRERMKFDAYFHLRFPSYSLKGTMSEKRIWEYAATTNQAYQQPRWRAACVAGAWLGCVWRGAKTPGLRSLHSKSALLQFYFLYKYI